MAEGIQQVEHWQFTETNFPFNSPIGHLDSWLWVGALWFNQGLIPPPVLLMMLLIGSLTLNFWITKHFARAWGCTHLSAWTVSLLFGLNGTLLNSILEGSWYLSSLFWLPCSGLSLLKFQQSKEQRWYILFVISWMGAILTSAYLGIVSSVMLLVLVLYLQPRYNIKQWFTKTLLPLLTMGIGYSVLFLYIRHDRFEDAANTVGDAVNMGSTTLWNYLMWNPDIDVFAHSLGPVGNIFGLWMLFGTPWLRLPESWRLWWVLAWFGVILSFGFQVALVDVNIGIPWFFSLFAHQSWTGFIHFPVRFHWMADLGGALLFGFLVTKYIPQPRYQAIVLGLVLINQTIIQGWYLRQGVRSYPIADAYATLQDSDGAILELYPMFTPQSDVDPLYIKNYLCLQQSTHHRPLLLSCMGTSTRDSVDWHLRGLLFEDLLHTQKRDWQALLPKLGIGTVVLHSNWFQPTDLNTLKAGLSKQLGNPIVHDVDNLLIWNTSAPDTNRIQLQTFYRETFPEIQWRDEPPPKKTGAIESA